MNEINAKRVSFLVGAVLFLCSPIAGAQEYVREIVKTGIVNDDLFISGEDVGVRADVKGDVVAMGEELTIAATVGGDIIAMAGHMNLDSIVAGGVFAMGGRLFGDGEIARDASMFAGSMSWSGRTKGPLLLAGGSVRMLGEAAGPVKILAGKVRQEGAIQGDLLVAGGKVVFTEASTVDGKVWVTGGKTEIDGAIRGELRIAAHSVEISGRIDGDVYIDGVEIEIDDGAVISGSLHYRSDREAEIASGATIAGDVEFTRSEAPRRMVGFAFAFAGMVALATVGGLILLGAVLLLACPTLFDRVSRNIGERFWASLGIGAAVVFAGPAVIALLVSLVIGIPLAIFIGALYVMALLMGILASGTVVGTRVLRAFGRRNGTSYWARLGVLALGTFLLAVVALIPFIGALVVLAAVVVGAGAMLHGVRRSCGADAS